MSIISHEVESELRKAMEARALERRGELSQAILDHYEGGPERLVMGLIEEFGKPENEILRGMVKAEVKRKGSDIVFAVTVDNDQFKSHKYGGTQEDHPGQRAMNIELRRRARNEAKEQVETLGRVLDDLRLAYDIKKQKDGGWEIKVSERTIDSALESVGQHNLESDTGRHAAMREFWKERNERPAQQFGQVAGSKAAEAIGRRYSLGREEGAEITR